MEHIQTWPEAVVIVSVFLLIAISMAAVSFYVTGKFPWQK